MTEVDGIQDRAFPTRAVRVVDAFGAGGGPDIIGRAIAERLAEMWGQRVIVENHTGAGSTAAPALVAEALADGYTLLIHTSAHAYGAAVSSSSSYDPLVDFVPVAALTSQPYVLVAGAPSGITSVDQLVSAAAASPGEMRFASAGPGTGTHVAVEKLNRDLGITAVHELPGPEDSMVEVIAGTAAGRSAYVMSPISFAAPHLATGDVVALGISTVRRSQLLPDVPSLAEAGVTDFDFPIWYGIWAPAHTPSAVVGKIAGDIATVLAAPELVNWLLRHDAEPMSMTQAEFAAFVISESERAASLLSNG